jgi:hypothetical protein
VQFNCTAMHAAGQGATCDSRLPNELQRARHAVFQSNKLNLP